MADEKITDLATATSIASGDLLVIVDVSDTTMDPTCTDKQISGSTLFAAIGLLTTVSVQTANYSANALEFVPVNATSGNITVLLPIAPADATGVGVSFVATASSHTCTVQTQGSDVFLVAGGATTTVFSTVGQTQI